MSRCVTPRSLTFFLDSVENKFGDSRSRHVKAGLVRNGDVTVFLTSDGGLDHDLFMPNPFIWVGDFGFQNLLISLSEKSGR